MRDRWACGDGGLQGEGEAVGEFDCLAGEGWDGVGGWL